ncbi:unnamed protein product [Effrenium voratum]|nr:unnamed protein product [Effrenium voratum]
MAPKWECSKCLEDNSDSEELCQWCDTVRDEADPLRRDKCERPKQPPKDERRKQPPKDARPQPPKDERPQQPPKVERPKQLQEDERERERIEQAEQEQELEEMWARRRVRLMQELAQVDGYGPEQRRSRLRALQLELHPDKHRGGDQRFAQEMFLLVQGRWEEDERARKRRMEAQQQEAEALARQEEALRRRQEAQRAAKAREEALQRQKEVEEAEQKSRWEAAKAKAEAELREEEQSPEQGCQEEGVQLDEEEEQEITLQDIKDEQLRIDEARARLAESLREELQARHREDEPMQVNISDIQGPLRSIWAERRWLVADLKKQLEKSEKLPALRQRLLLGDQDVDDLQSLWDLAGGNALNLVLVVCMDKHCKIEPFMAAFSGSWRILQSAAAPIRANSKILKLALSQDWRALSSASPALRADYAIARRAVRCSGLALEILPLEMRNDRALVLQAVQQTWKALKFASLRLRGDKDRGSSQASDRSEGQELLDLSVWIGSGISASNLESMTTI